MYCPLLMLADVTLYYCRMGLRATFSDACLISPFSNTVAANEMFTCSTQEKSLHRICAQHCACVPAIRKLGGAWDDVTGYSPQPFIIDKPSIPQGSPRARYQGVAFSLLLSTPFDIFPQTLTPYYKTRDHRNGLYQAYNER